MCFGLPKIYEVSLRRPPCYYRFDWQFALASCRAQRRTRYTAESMKGYARLHWPKFVRRRISAPVLQSCFEDFSPSFAPTRGQVGRLRARPKVGDWAPFGGPARTGGVNGGCGAACRQDWRFPIGFPGSRGEGSIVSNRRHRLKPAVLAHCSGKIFRPSSSARRLRVNLSTVSTQKLPELAGEFSGRVCAVWGRGRGRTHSCQLRPWILPPLVDNSLASRPSSPKSKGPFARVCMFNDS